MGSRKEITLKEIASRVGVSVSTASRALQQHPSISADVRRRVLSVADELGYKPLRGGEHTNTSRAVGVIVPSIKVPYYARLVTGVTRVADINGYDVVLRLSRYRTEFQDRHIGQLVGSKVDGIIVSTTQSQTPGLQHAADEGVPVIHLDNVPEHSPAYHVSVDDEDAGYQAAQYLISLGHREMLYLSGPQAEGIADGKFAGLSRALREAGLKIATGQRVQIPAFQVEPTVAAMKVRMQKPDRFTAIVASDDVLAFGAYRAVLASGLAVPNDVSIIGLNGNRLSGGLDLTTVMLPAGQVGRGAMQMVIDVSQKKIKPPQSVQIKGSLVVRGSCAPPAEQS